MAIPVVPSKREVIEIPFGKDETLLSSKLDHVCVDGEPYKSTGPAFTPSVVRSGDELAKRQGLLPAIRFHRLKYRPDGHAAAMGYSPHLWFCEAKCLPRGICCRSFRLIQQLAHFANERRRRKRFGQEVNSRLHHAMLSHGLIHPVLLNEGIEQQLRQNFVA